MKKKRASNKLNIQAYLHCALCLNELKRDNIPQSPKEYQQIQAGWTPEGLQIWCSRHNCNIIHIDFENQRHPADTTREKE